MYPIKTKTKYNPSNLATTANIYTTVYLWNYVTWDFDEGNWSHPWVDMIPQVKHDNIYACLDGHVQFAWTSASNWNYIVLKHDNMKDPEDISKTVTLYSCHLHLSELLTQTWATVKEWDIIWKTWNTWNSTWEHLHFQIDRDTAPFHPYWPFTFKDAQDLWYGFFEAVNHGLWIDNARKYTINPLPYLDKVSGLSSWQKVIVEEKRVVEEKKPETAATVVKPNLGANTVTVPTVKKDGSIYFTDVKEDVDAIDFLASAWVTKWYADWTFRPSSNITRAELLAMTFVFAKVPLIDGTASWVHFSDVDKDSWPYRYVVTASSKWIVSWYDDGTFRPNNPVSRVEAAAIILNTIVWKSNISAAVDSDFIDVPKDAWYCKYANFIAQNWLLDSVWNFYPNDNMQRKDVAILLYNLRSRAWY